MVCVDPADGHAGGEVLLKSGVIIFFRLPNHTTIRFQKERYDVDRIIPHPRRSNPEQF